MKPVFSYEKNRLKARLLGQNPVSRNRGGKNPENRRFFMKVRILINKSIQFFLACKINFHSKPTSEPRVRVTPAGLHMQTNKHRKTGRTMLVSLGN